MSDFGADFWVAQHASGALGAQVDPHLRALMGGRRPGSALDVGCGHGGSARWLAAQGWRVTGVDVVPAALAAAEAATSGLANPPSWQQGDVLTGWRPAGPADGWDLVCSFHVHPDGPMARFVARLGELVAPGGTLLVVGHDAADPARRRAPADPSIVGAELAAPLRAAGWSVRTTREVRQPPRHQHGSVHRDHSASDAAPHHGVDQHVDVVLIAEQPLADPGT